MPEATRSQEPTGEPVDSSPLRLDQLSAEEFHAIFRIECRLREVQDTLANPRRRCLPKRYTAPVETRYRRVLLLDGARGTGKTSLLLTLAHRWNPDNASLVDAHDPKHNEECVHGLIRHGYVRSEEFGGLEIPATLTTIPQGIVVVGRILDFDTLPPAVPLIAGIVQAWRQIAEEFDKLREIHNGPEDQEDGTLLDLWHRLFRVAAAGWTDLPPTQSLIEQVLDREEQLEDWHNLDKQWTKFIDRLIESGQRCPREMDRLSKQAVVVVMIDDVDLQVQRIRQLLPALRLLYHKRVVFVVAADLEHMEHMLCADFHGQQNRLARHQNATNTPLTEIIRTDSWSLELARSSIEKVFARRNRWELKKLQLLQFLDFPGKAWALQFDRAANDRTEDGAADSETTSENTDARRNSESKESFFSDLEAIPVPEWPGSTEQTGTGARIRAFARDAEKFGLGGVMTFRTAIQLYERVQTFEFKSERRGMEVLAELISNNDRDERAVVLKDESIYLPMRGELAALHRSGPTMVGVSHSFVLSARPDFVFIPSGADHPISMRSGAGRHLNLTGLLVAKMLEELRYSVDAGGLLWNTFLSHVWTEWYLGPRLAFAWTRPFHPRPEEHLEQAKDWESFVKDQRVQQANEDQVEKWAYAWIYYQRKWCGHDVNELAKPGEAFPESEKSTEAHWKKLCNISTAERQQESTSKEHRWLKNTLPLLARPELGFPVPVQEILLSTCKLTKERETLRRQRRRLITDAFVAADVQRGGVGREGPKDEEIERLIDQIDSIYAEEHESQNPWRESVEEVLSKKRGASGSE